MCVCVRVFLCVCVCMRACVRAWVCACVRACISPKLVYNVTQGLTEYLLLDIS